MCDSVVLRGILGRGVTLIYSVSHTELTYFLSNIMELDFYFMEKHCCSHGKSTQEVLILSATIKGIRATKCVTFQCPENGVCACAE